MNKELTNEMNEEFAKTMKIGLVATIDENNYPHITILSTLMGQGKKTMIFGKFVEGLSKEFITQRPKAGFFIMNTEKEFWFGKMNYSHIKKEGEDYINYNNQPLYRYNSYFGINTVYYNDLVEISDSYKLPMGKVVMNALIAKCLKGKYKGDPNKPGMNYWTKNFTSKLDTLTFIAYIDDLGYPNIVPVISAQSASSSRIAFRNKPYEDLLSPIKPGQNVSILAFSMSMEAVLIKGIFSGFDKLGMSYIDINRVYNSMPPVHKYIYEGLPNE